MRTRSTVSRAVGASLVAIALVGAAQAADTAGVKPLKPLATVATALQPGQLSMVATDDSIWIDTAKGVQRIDPKANAVVATILMPRQFGIGLAAAAGSVWATDFDKNVVTRIDPATNKVVETIAVGAGPQDLTFANGALWVGNKHGGSVSRIDPTTNMVVATVKVGLPGPGGPQSTVGGFGDIWVAVSNNNAFVRIDPTTNQPKAQVKIPRTAAACGAIAVARTRLWASSCDNFPTVAEINPLTNKVSGLVFVGGYALGAVVAGGKAWYAVVDAAGRHPRLVRVEPGKKKPTAVRVLAPGVKSAGAMVRAFGSLWVADAGSGKVLRFPASVLK